MLMMSYSYLIICILHYGVIINKERYFSDVTNIIVSMSLYLPPQVFVLEVVDSEAF